ncbi:hypothetical protein [Catalinimonas niigatensis]|uniref:hypothetical protein n=1 Tax=Catalinimonas niigatensis TaxID=1397264 RepID=UPI0026667FBC|nr:hypothetical protein [Catalinimonas niigatensis]WPP49925.1 hypothetical protein PZB72_24990 [Catalinimonas niigatensis]
MKYYTSFLFAFVFLLGLSSCYDEPEFALEPYLVGFDGDNGIRFVDVPNTIADSLIIRVEFQDGNGDLGLVSNESDPVLREQYIFYLDDSGDYIRYNAEVDAVNGRLDCTKFAYFNVIGRDTIQDTIRVDINPYYFNFDVGLYVKEDGEFQEYDFLKELCRPRLGGRFTHLKEDFNNTKPLEGIIEYGIASTGLVTLFRNDTLKLTVKIRDRAKNESNVIESRPFVLRSEGSIYADE